MIRFPEGYPLRKKPLGYLRLLRARHHFFDSISLNLKRNPKNHSGYGFVKILPGYQSRLASLRDTQNQRSCVVVANGPSLKEIDPISLKPHLLIGCNGIYNLFDTWGFKVDYLVFEDIEQTAIRADEINKIKEIPKLASLYNAFCLKPDADTIFFYSPRFSGDGYAWKDIYPRFSEDFASIVHLGSTVTYIMIQLAFHLGCDPVYLVGLDHDYGRIAEIFPPGKITITEENLHLVESCHFSKSYYKIGDTIGIPWKDKQEKAFELAANTFKKWNRKLLNATPNTKLAAIERCEWPPRKM